MMKPPRIARTLSCVIPASVMLLALPALAAPVSEAPASYLGSNFNTSSSLLALDSSAPTGNVGERIKLAGKLSSAVRGAAIGSRAARGSNKSDEQNVADTEQEAESASENQKSSPDGDAGTSGPFKVMVPGQGSGQAAPLAAEQPDPSRAAETPVDKPAQATVNSQTAPASGPVRTILDRSGKDPSADQAAVKPAATDNRTKPAQKAAAPAAISPAPSTSAANPALAPRQAAEPAATNAPDSGCIAGCYAPTSTQLTGPAGRRAATTQQSGLMTTPAPAAQNVIQNGNQNRLECLAGCDGIDGNQLPRATTGAPGQAAADASQNGSNRVVIMRSNSRTKSYGVNQ